MRRILSMKLRYFLSVSLFAALLAGCGGGGGAGTLSSSDIAVVAGQHISKATFDQMMNQQKLSLQAQGKSFPKAGSTDYASLEAQVVAVLVQNAEFDAEAKKLGVNVTDKQVQTQLDQIKKQYFSGSEAKYQQQLKAQGYTDAAVRNQIREQLVSQALFDKVTKNVTPTTKEVQSYYAAHKSEYPPTRSVSEILVGKNKQSLAQQIYSRLKANDTSKNFSALAKKYSQDPGSKDSGGLFTAKKGQDVPEFDAAVFNAKNKTGSLLQPVSTKQYGWFVIKLLGPIQPETEADVDSTIRATVQQQDRNQQMTDWVTGVTKSFCSGGKIKYQAGYAPSPDPCAALATATNTSTTG